MPHDGKPKRPGRELQALVLVATWIAGVELAPLAHVAVHSALPAHVHGAGDAPPAHCHGDTCHEHEDATPSEGATTPADSHGAHSLLHRSIALKTPGVATPRVPPPVITPLEAERAVATIPASPTLARPRARAPPV